MNSKRPSHSDRDDPRIQAAVAQLREMIARRYPEAGFEIATGDDPEGVYRNVTVDVDDLDEVADVFMDRRLELQIDRGLPVYVFPSRPLGQVIERMRAGRATRPRVSIVDMADPPRP